MAWGNDQEISLSDLSIERKGLRPLKELKLINKDIKNNVKE